MLLKIRQILQSIISTVCQRNTIMLWSAIETPKNLEMQGQTLSAFRCAILNHINL